MASIQEYLDLIKNAIYGKDVRQAIHDGILQCYLDASGDHYQILDAKVNNLKNNKVNQPLDSNNQPTNGTDGQSLRTKGDGTTEWADVGLPTDEQTAQAVSDWLDAHPEATTTVADGSLTEAKFSNALKLKAIKDYVTPEMFGAVGDGVADDTTAVSDALSYATTNKLPLVLISKYLLSAGLTVDSGVSIIGKSSGNGFVVNSPITAITLPNDSYRQTLRNFTFTMQNQLGIAIKINYVRWADISNIFVIDAENAIKMDGAYYCNINKCDFHYCNKAVVLENCGGITLNGCHINECIEENIYINAESSVQICNCTLENPLSVAQLVCDRGDLSITNSYFGDSEFPTVIVNGGNVKVTDMNQAILNPVVNGGTLYLDNVRWGGAIDTHAIEHNGGKLILGEHQAISYIDVKSSDYTAITSPLKKTYSKDGLFIDTSNITLGTDTSIHLYGINYCGGCRIKVYSSKSNPSTEPSILIPFSVPTGLVGKTILLKIMVDNEDRYEHQDFSPSGSGVNTIVLDNNSDLSIGDWSDVVGGRPLPNLIWNYSDSWKRVFFGTKDYPKYQVYIPVIPKQTTGSIKFVAGISQEYDKMMGIEYMALVNPTDAYMFAKYV